MSTKQKSLQKFTESKNKIDNLLAKGRQITLDDIRGLKLTDKGIGYFLDLLHENLDKLRGVERDNFINNVYDLIDDNTKNQLWEYNHNQITYAISNLIQESNRMPSKNEIAREAELSRQTVHKHLSEYSQHPLYLQQMDKFRFLTSKVLTKVFQYAINGDTGAAKLYFNVMGYLGGQPSNGTLIKNQNNYIQINGITLSQEAVKSLDPEQLRAIEAILKTALPKGSNIESKGEGILTKPNIQEC